MAQRFLTRDFNMSFLFNSSRTISASGIFDPSATDFSVNVWFKVKLASSGTLQVLVAQQNGTGTGRNWLALAATGGVLRTNFPDGGAHDGTLQVVAGVWNMATFTKTGTTLSLYLNSILDQTFTLTAQAANGALEVGQDKANGNGYAGFITDLQIYNVLLTQAQITTLYFQGTQPSTPYIWYKLNEGQGTVAIDSGTAANNGTITKGSGDWAIDVPMKSRLPVRNYGTSVYNKGGSAWSYSASTDFNVTGSFTLGAWVKRGIALLSTYTIMAKGRSGAGGNNYSYALFIDGGNKLQGRISKDGTTQSQIASSINSAWPDQMWHHCAMSYQQVADGTSIITLYFDGQIVAKFSTAASPLAASTADLGVGTDFTGAGHAATGNVFNGFLDEAFFYNGVLTQAQIQDLMRYGTGSTQVLMTDSNLYGFWTFDENSGTTTVDKSSRGNNLTINTATAWNSEVVMKARSAASGRSTATGRSSV